MNKSFLTNLIAALITAGSYVSPLHGDLIFMVGIFALSGGITNWIAIHMLFEKVPLLYGSGVIPNRFEDFKAGIKTLIVNEFFTREHIERFFQQNGAITPASIVEKVDYDRVFAGLTDAIEQSKLGSMLAMVGGVQALEPLREPVTLKLKDIIADLVDQGVTGGDGNGDGKDFTDSLIEKVEHIIDNRLNELTPENVKRIVQDMIRKHLGWLVVWGGVFGGAIGLLVGILER